MNVYRLFIALFLFMMWGKSVFAANDGSIVQLPPNPGRIGYPPQPGVQITLVPSLWYGFTDRTGPLFKNSAAQPVGLQTAHFGGPIGGFTVTVDPHWTMGYLANTLFNFSAYSARESGNFSAVYYKTRTNDEDNSWKGTGNENSQDYEVLALKELLSADKSAGSSSASMLALVGARYIDIDTAIVGHDIFQNQLLYKRQNKFYLGEVGVRFVAPLASGWRLMLGGTGLYGTTYDQNGEVCGCGSVEHDNRNTRAEGYDFYGGIEVIPHEINPNIPEGIGISIRYRDRSLYTVEQGVVAIDHQLGPEIRFAWQFPASPGE